MLLGDAGDLMLHGKHYAFWQVMSTTATASTL